MPINKPAELPRWATGVAVMSEPSEPTKDTGFVPGTDAAAAHVNWLFNQLYQWMQYVDDPATLTTAALVTGALTATGNATVGGTLGVTGNTTLGGTLGVTGNTTVGGTLGVTGALTASGGITVPSGQTSALQGNATVGGTLGVTGATTLGSTLGVTGNTTVGGTLGVTGATTLSGGVTVPSGQTSALQGNATVGGTLGVTGAATLGSTLGVTGATTLSSTLGVTSNATVGGTLGVTGALTANGGLTAGANQFITVSGTGDYKHGDRMLQLPASAGIPVNLSNGMSGQPATSSTGWKYNRSSGAAGQYWYGPTNGQVVHFPVPLDVNRRIKAVHVKIQDTGGIGNTISVQLHRTVTTSSFTTGSVLVATATSLGNNNVQTVSLNSLTQVINQWEFYNIAVIANGGPTPDFTNHKIAGLQIVYDRP